jgi:hypothetical protein
MSYLLFITYLYVIIKAYNKDILHQDNNIGVMTYYLSMYPTTSGYYLNISNTIIIVTIS